MTAHLSPKVYASDICDPLIEMWIALQSGWQPPSDVSEADYERAKMGGDLAERAFIGFGCSFGGKWFGGYARGAQHESRRVRARNYAENARNSVLKQSAAMADVSFSTADFMVAEPPEPRCFVYCDPPFAGTTGYPGMPPFDSVAFWARCDQLIAEGHEVAVSEYTAPPRWEPVLWVRSKKRKRLGHGADASYRYDGDLAVEQRVDPDLDIEQVWVRRGGDERFAKMIDDLVGRALRKAEAERDALSRGFADLNEIVNEKQRAIDAHAAERDAWRERYEDLVATTERYVKREPDGA